MKTRAKPVHQMILRGGARSARSARPTYFVAAVLLTTASLWAGPARAMLNPDDVYCTALGYQYLTAHSKRGVFGVCKLPDGTLVNASDFSHGRVALEHSYCAKQGLEAKRDTTGKVCRDCLVCVQADGQEVPATALMGLSYRESVCGDGQCGTMEDTSNCEVDCPSGGLDEYCDGLSDGICDPDCVNLGQHDPDCGQTGADPSNKDASGCSCDAGTGGAGATGLWLLVLLATLALRLRRRWRRPVS